jgi:hypothetical protein
LGGYDELWSRIALELAALGLPFSASVLKWMPIILMEAVY